MPVHIVWDLEFATLGSVNDSLMSNGQQRKYLRTEIDVLCRWATIVFLF